MNENGKDKKRNTVNMDRNRWEDPWYRELSPEIKNVWDYILARCDLAGVWKVDLKLAAFSVGADLPGKEKLFSLLNAGAKTERIKLLSGTNDDNDTETEWCIPGYAAFQCGKLNPRNRYHKSVLKTLIGHGLPTGLTRANERTLFGHARDKHDPSDSLARDTLESKGRIRDGTGKARQGKARKTAGDYPDDFLAFWKKYPRHVGKGAAWRRWQVIVKSVSADVIIAGAERYTQECAKEQREEQYIAHPSTWLNAGRWDDEPTADRASGGEPTYAKWTPEDLAKMEKGEQTNE